MGKENKGTENWNRTVIPERVRERAFTRHELELDCWISTYSTGSHGYAQIGWGGNEITKRGVVLAHRASWEHVNGPMPIGKTLDHICKSKKCVNPGHLRVLENYENARRTAGRDWPLGECANGHSNDLLEVFADGRTHCGICARNWKRNWASRSAATRAPKPRREPKPRPKALPKPIADRKRRLTSTHCLRGHELTPENTYTKPRETYTQCRTCKADRAREWYAKQERRICPPKRGTSA